MQNGNIQMVFLTVLNPLLLKGFIHELISSLNSNSLCCQQCSLCADYGSDILHVYGA